ncbi:ApeP family dehydratase [Confluentibacter flavum]|uniref:Uncharacterized protein n=1 Tax=Confluentibacter flavum TaxID=1909700 RepID=A0A2N3HKL0_9FLAO|nr:hypothetical protein [Confluentibacter flavum]PKQ45477.1 hypothetical protein CSW08_07910 [Confluentibacter flavum]
MDKHNKLKVPILDPEFIEKLLPHRKPMVMVDALVFFSDKKAISKLSISPDNIFVINGVFSETGLIENMAQTAALYIGYKQFLNNKVAKDGFIGSIKSTQIISLPKLNDTISTEINVIYEIGNMILVKINSTLNGITIGISEMSTVLKDSNI